MTNQMQMKLSVIIVSYNVKYLLEQCLRSVLRACDGLESEVWVVDNASSDGSYAYLHERFQQVHFVQNEENVGFSRANNLAIRKSSGQYVLLLNPDTLVAEDTLRQCIAYLDEHPDVGAAGVKMLNPDGSFAPESRRGLPTPMTSFYKMVGLARLFPTSRTFGKYYMRYLSTDAPAEIEVISGAFFMARRAALDTAGLLDETFFMYGEDIDLSYRLLQHGWKNVYLPERILHYKGESTVKSSYRYVSVFYNAMLIFFNKHYRRRYRVLGFFIKLAVLLRAFVDMCESSLQRILVALHLVSPKRRPSRCLRFDFDTTPVSQMLDALESQTERPRAVIETVSAQAGTLIRPGESMPLSESVAQPVSV